VCVIVSVFSMLHYINGVSVGKHCPSRSVFATALKFLNFTDS
jgi:hypothetical protein